MLLQNWQPECLYIILGLILVFCNIDKLCICFLCWLEKEKEKEKSSNDVTVERLWHINGLKRVVILFSPIQF